MWVTATALIRKKLVGIEYSETFLGEELKISKCEKYIFLENPEIHHQKMSHSTQSKTLEHIPMEYDNSPKICQDLDPIGKNEPNKAYCISNYHFFQFHSRWINFFR